VTFIVLLNFLEVDTLCVGKRTKTHFVKIKLRIDILHDWQRNVLKAFFFIYKYKYF